MSFIRPFWDDESHLIAKLERCIAHYRQSKDPLPAPSQNRLWSMRRWRKEAIRPLLAILHTSARQERIDAILVLTHLATQGCITLHALETVWQHTCALEVGMHAERQACLRFLASTNNQQLLDSYAQMLCSSSQPYPIAVAAYALGCAKRRSDSKKLIATLQRLQLQHAQKILSFEFDDQQEELHAQRILVWALGELACPKGLDTVASCLEYEPLASAACEALACKQDAEFAYELAQSAQRATTPQDAFVRLWSLHQVLRGNLHALCDTSVLHPNSNDLRMLSRAAQILMHRFPHAPALLTLGRLIEKQCTHLPAQTRSLHHAKRICFADRNGASNHRLSRSYRRWFWQ